MGCCKPYVQTVTEYKMVVPPQSLLQPCPQINVDMKTNGDMVMTLIELNTQYYLCSMKVQSLIDFYSSSETLGE